MSFEDNVRIMNFDIYLDNTSIDSVVFAKEFLRKYRHPDTQLSIKLKTNSYENFYDATSILTSLDNVFLNIETNHIENLDLINLYDKIIVDKKSNYKEEDEDIIFLASNNKNLIVNYIIDENNIELYEFKNFYDVLRVYNTYEIDFFTEFKNKKKFTEDIIKQFDLILKDNINYIYNINYSDPRKNLVLKNNMITHLQYSNMPIVDDNLNVSLEHIFSKTNLKNCKGCDALEVCRGGDYTIFENTNNSDIFCAINMGIIYLKNKYIGV